MSKILFIGEKPRASRIILESAPKSIQEATVSVLNILPLSSISFSIPRNIKYHDIPYVNDVRYKRGDIQPNLTTFVNNKHIKIEKVKFLDENNTLIDFFSLFEKIIIATDPDHTGELAAHIWLSWGGVNSFKDNRIKRLIAFNYESNELKKTWDELDNSFMNKRFEYYNYALAKRYFDYNWTINSSVVFGDLLRSIGLDTHNFILSKNQLMILFILKNNINKMSEGKIIKFINCYTGTGKYNISDYTQHHIFGSPTSRVLMISKMIDIGLLESNKNNVSLSIKGCNFLNMLHNKTFDPDLHFRLANWSIKASNDGYESVKQSIKRYINSVFGKQVKRSINA